MTFLLAQLLYLGVVVSAAAPSWASTDDSRVALVLRADGNTEIHDLGQEEVHRGVLPLVRRAERGETHDKELREVDSSRHRDSQIAVGQNAQRTSSSLAVLITPDVSEQQPSGNVSGTVRGNATNASASSETFAAALRDWWHPYWTVLIAAADLQIVAILPMLFGSGLVLMSFCAYVSGLLGGHRSDSHALRPSVGAESEGHCSNTPEPVQLPDRSIATVVALTAYKFYIGFLNATWVPFLVAKEGEHLMQDRQSLFMGLAKLIFGFSIFLNPMFGLVSDRLTMCYPRQGRSVFIFIGVTLEGIALIVAKAGSAAGAAGGYLAATALWMLGEAVVDVTSEAILPELVPPRQFDLASSVRSLHFLAGALVGNLTLLLLVGRGIDWLYVAYMGLMLACALPPLALTRILTGTSSSAEALAQPRRAFGAADLVACYLAPLRYTGCFPQACLCLFTFGLSTGPIFFTLLFVRDLVGVHDQVEQQRQFGLVSIAFLLSAAAGSLTAGAGPQRSDLAATPPGAAAEPAPGPDAAAGGAPRDARVPGSQGAEVRRWTLMAVSTLCYSAACLCCPLAALPQTMERRLVSLYVVSVVLGLAFGSVYARFKACTWVLLPAGANVGNAMGVAGLCQVVGTGLGNFLVGVLLDQFRASEREGYTFGAYVAMSIWSALSSMACTVLVTGILKQQKGGWWAS